MLSSNYAETMYDIITMVTSCRHSPYTQSNYKMKLESGEFILDQDYWRYIYFKDGGWLLELDNIHV